MKKWNWIAFKLFVTPLLQFPFQLEYGIFMTWFRFLAEWKYTVCKEITQTSTNTPTHMHTCTHWFSKLNKNYVFKLKGLLFSRGCALISSLAFSWAKFLATAFVPSKYFFRKQSPVYLIFFSTTFFLLLKWWLWKDSWLQRFKYPDLNIVWWESHIFV